jgi:hypothetical protein
MSEVRSLPREPQPSDVFLNNLQERERNYLKALLDKYTDEEISANMPFLDIEEIKTIRAVFSDVEKARNSSSLLQTSPEKAIAPEALNRKIRRWWKFW